MKAKVPHLLFSPRSGIKRPASDFDDDYDELGRCTRKDVKKHDIFDQSEQAPCFRCLKGMLTPGADVVQCACVPYPGKSAICYRCHRHHARCEPVPDDIISSAKAVQNAVTRIRNGEVVENFDMIAGACRAALKLPITELTATQNPPQARQKDITSFFGRPARQASIRGASQMSYQASFEANFRFDKNSPPSSQEVVVLQDIPEPKREKSPEEPVYIPASFKLFSKSYDVRKLKEERAALEIKQFELSKKISQLEQELVDISEQKILLNAVIGDLNLELTKMCHLDSIKDLRNERMAHEEQQCMLSNLMAEKETQVDALEEEKIDKNQRIDHISKLLSEE